MNARRFLLCLPVFFICLAVNAQTLIKYKESYDDFANPERGFYIPSSTTAGKFVPLDAGRLLNMRHEVQKLKNARYSIYVSLLYRAYELDTFKTKPLSDTFLVCLQRDFDVVRKAGLKIILRFAYTNASHGGDCNDEYKICPPYGDASPEVVLQHIRQLQPLFVKNADIIAVLQEGFIGIWGENYFTDYFGSGTNDGVGVIADSNWVKRNMVLKALLDALPPQRMVQVRTPQIKQRFVAGPLATPATLPMVAAAAFNKTDAARIGFHNDCFLSSADDYGTFYDYGNSTHKRDTAEKQLRSYFEADSRFTPVGGETCDDAYSPQNDCAPMGHAEREMAAMHYSYLNAAYNNSVNNDWDSLGCMMNIKRKLGYRLQLKEARLPALAKAGGSIDIAIMLYNDGFTSPYNERPVQLLLRNTKTHAIVAHTLSTAIQHWYPGTIAIRQKIALPASLAKGRYEYLLNLPDSDSRIQNNPDYSIRLANAGCWEPVTGYNRLGQEILVQ